MSITLDLPINIENALLQEAKARQQELSSLVIEYLGDKVSNEVNDNLDLKNMLCRCKKDT